jgi:hypothetical protein
MKMTIRRRGWKGRVYCIYSSTFHDPKGKDVYLCSNPKDCPGLRAYHLDDIELENDEVEFVTFQEKLPPFSKEEPKTQQMHPVLYQILKVEDDWQLYEGIVEGVPEDWAEFTRRLGHEP